MVGDAHGMVWLRRGMGTLLFFLCVVPVIAAYLPLLETPSDTITLGVELISSPRLWGLWGKTCFIALGSALLAVFLGAPLGLILDQTRRGVPLLIAILVTPLLLPAHTLAVAWIDVLGPQGLLAQYGLPRFSIYTAIGVVLVHGLSWYPVPMLLTWFRMRQMDPDLLEAARNLGTPTMVFRHITLPTLLPTMATATIFVFTLSLLSFSIPSLLQVPVFTVEIFASFNSLLDQRQALLLATPLLLVGLFTAATLQRLVTSWATPLPAWQRGRSNTAQPRCVPIAGVVLFACVSIGLPYLALITRIGSLSAMVSAWSTGIDEIVTSLILGVLGASLLLALVLPVTLLSPRPSLLPLWASAIAFLVSGPVMGVGLIQCWNLPGIPGYIYDHFPILLIAILGRYALFAWLGCQLLTRWIPADRILAARNLGASPWQVIRSIVWPQIRRPLMGVWAGLFLLILGELECIVLLAPPGWVPVSLRIFTLMHYGPAAMVSALSLLQAIVAMAIIFLCTMMLQSANVYTSIKSKYYRERRR